MKALTAGALVAVTLGLCVWVGSGRANAAGFHVRRLAILAPTVRSSRLLLHGRVRCTATVRSQLRAGQSVSVKLVLRNVSKRPVKVFLGVFASSAVLHAADGTTYDSTEPLKGLPGVPPPIPTTIRPGKTKLAGRVAIPVRWRGPLRVTPECMGKALPVLGVRVTAPWPRPQPSDAIDEVVAASVHLLDHCRPQTPDFPVSGHIDPPSGNAPPLNTECSISLSSEGRFLVAHVLVLTPPGLTGVQIFQPYETLWPVGQFVGLASSPPYEAIAWAFVVTREKAIPVAAATLTATNTSDAMAPYFGWTGSGWKQNGSGSCGGTGFAFGSRGPEIEFISACPA